MTVFYDVFNGDADGLCALHQLRLADPRVAQLVTGTKRELALLERIAPQRGDQITVLDVAFDLNADALLNHLERGAQCRYFDHHSHASLPVHPQLETHIDTSPELCTSLIVDRHLHGRHRVWAVAAAFGDNLSASARAAALTLGLQEQQLLQLKELGECLNYNAYGDSVDDLHYHPADLYLTLSRYADPFEFLCDEPIVGVLRAGRADDLYRAQQIAPEFSSAHCALYVLPDAAWSRRVSGSFANVLAARHPRRAHAVLTAQDGGYSVSVRASIEQPQGADALCRAFGGGGRRGAAGIPLLPNTDYGRFAKAFERAYAPALN
jgi:hypothetical protein